MSGRTVAASVAVCVGVCGWGFAGGGQPESEKGSGTTGGRWVVQPSGVEDDLQDVTFLDDRVGIASG